MNVGRPETRPIVFARCRFVPGPGDKKVTFNGVDFGIVGGRTGFFDHPAGFWRHLRSLRKEGAILLVLSDPNRDLALMGLPEGFEWRLSGRSEPLPCDCAGGPQAVFNRPGDAGNHLFMGTLARGHRAWQVIGLSNWHPDGMFCNGLSFKEGLAEVRAHVRAIETHALGPEVMNTIPQQAMRSFRRHTATHSRGNPDWRLCSHENEELAEFEYRALRSQSPFRKEPYDSHIYDTLYKVDFTAHYLSIMAHELLPVRPRHWIPEGMDAAELDAWADDPTGAFIANVVTVNGESGFVLSPHWAAARPQIAAVRQAALYGAGDVFQSWAQAMFEAREADPANAVLIKRIGVSLWGYLSRRNRSARFYDDDGGTDIWGEHLEGRGRVWDQGIGLEWDSAGRHCRTEPHRVGRGRHFALGAFMIGLGERKLAELMELVPPHSVVAGHTDSLFTTEPIPGIPLRSKGHAKALGTLVYERLRYVQWRNGVRYVGGDVDAAPGVKRLGTVTYAKFDESDSPPLGIARIEAP